MPVSRRGGDELALRRFPEVEASAEAVAGPPINGASASFISRRHDCGFIVNLPGEATREGKRPSDFISWRLK